VLRLEGVPRHYAWGSTTAIPRLLGQTADGRPVAELWFGAHVSGPSRVTGAAAPGDLAALIRSDPAKMLGEDVTARFGVELPYLLKIIAAERPLSLQVHPHLARARTGYDEESAAGVPLDSPTRTYRDRNHKPELVFALTRFEALSGFRAPRRAAEILSDLDSQVARTLAGILRQDPTASGVRTAFQWVLDPVSRPCADDVDDLVAACAARLDRGSTSIRADRNVVLLAECFPGDPGVVTSLLLNPVTLQPGEAMFIPVGGVHAYLSGVAVEVMANSDNVLRAGLTAKHVDAGELLASVDYVAAPPVRIAPELANGVTQVFYAPVDDFELSVSTVADGQEHRIPGRGPRVVVCLDGEVEVRAGTDRLQLVAGEAAFAAAADGPLTLAGRGRVVQADVP
jgi:mannose-6-phosphate isomerase